MHELLKQYFGYDQFRPLQEDIIGNVLNGRDTLVIMPTGGGKSLCYQLPALKLPGLTLVISPLIALMKDQVDALQQNGIAAAVINSTLAAEEMERVQEAAREGEVKILYVAPERLAMQSFQLFLHDLQISLIAVDEAHCISEWGHEFRPDYRNLAMLRLQFPHVPFIALTATATPRVQADIVAQLAMREPKQFLASFDRPNLKFSVAQKQGGAKRLLGLIDQHKGESAIVYCFSRKDTEKIADLLNAAGFSARPYHAGLSAEVRQKNQELFIKDGCDIIVATIAFGMGIDKPDVRLVVHYTFPKSLEGYYQEVGRAGRDGLPAECVMLYSAGDAAKHEFFINETEDEMEREQLRAKLRQMMVYAESRSCRRQQLLDYFADARDGADTACGNCDNCLEVKETFDATELAQKIMSAILRTGSRFGKGYIVDVLKAKTAEKITRNGHDQLSVFGICRDVPKETLHDVINQLVQKKLLYASEGKYPTLSLTSAGAQLLNKRESLQLYALPTPEKEKKTKAPAAKTDLQYEGLLFDQLRDLRKQLAAERNVPPYLIFGDVTLQEMAYYLPENMENLRNVQGVGEKKLKEFADVFLAAIKKYIQAHGKVPRDFPADRRAERLLKKSATIGASQIATKLLVVQKLSLTEIARQRGMALSTIIAHIEALRAAEEALDLQHLRPSAAEFEEIKAAFLQTNNDYLKPVFDLLKSKYTYEQIRVARWFL